MNVIAECESVRLVEQVRLDQRKTARQRNCWGQFATPPELALDIARYAWKKLRRRDDNFRFLDPAIGTGSFFAAFRRIFPADRVEQASGIELDPEFAKTASAIWREQGLKIVCGDFTKQKPRLHNVILANPPYVRHHHLAVDEKQRLNRLVYEATGLQLSGLSGLYCYFLLLAHAWLADNGFAVWLIPSEFMDVNYGEVVKRYLAEDVTTLHIHRFCPSDVQFDDALVSSAVVVFEKRKPSPNHAVEFSFGGTLEKPAKSTMVPLSILRAASKWSMLAEKPVGHRGKACRATLGDFFTVKRGIATGNNDFFVVPKSRLQEIGIPLDCVKPILPSPRFLRQEIIESDSEGWPLLETPLALVDCPLAEMEIQKKWPKFGEYLEEGKRREVHAGYLAARRSPWYSQERRPPATFLCTYMGRSLERPFRFIWNQSQATAANVYLLLYPREFVAENVRQYATEIFEAFQTIRPQDFFDKGRVYGGGLYKMEPAELMRLPAERFLEILDVKPERQMAFF